MAEPCTSKEDSVLTSVFTDTFDRKMDALRSHASQHSDWDPITEMIRGWLTATAKLAAFPDGN